jgi:hypothetical protein
VRLDVRIEVAASDEDAPVHAHAGELPISDEPTVHLAAEGARVLADPVVVALAKLGA